MIDDVLKYGGSVRQENSVSFQWKKIVDLAVPLLKKSAPSGSSNFYPYPNLSAQPSVAYKCLNYSNPMSGPPLIFISSQSDREHVITRF